MPPIKTSTEGALECDEHQGADFPRLWIARHVEMGAPVMQNTGAPALHRN